MTTTNRVVAFSQTGDRVLFERGNRGVLLTECPSLRPIASLDSDALGTDADLSVSLLMGASVLLRTAPGDQETLEALTPTNPASRPAAPFSRGPSPNKSSSTPASAPAARPSSSGRVTENSPVCDAPGEHAAVSPGCAPYRGRSGRRITTGWSSAPISAASLSWTLAPSRSTSLEQNR